MCLILLAWRHHPRYPLVIAANRDEFRARPSAAVRFWSDRPDILGGRDLQQGGTWLGISRGGRVAAVTNYREAGPPVSPALSRGWLVQEFLLGTEAPGDYLREVQSRAELYNGFGLFVGDTRRICYYSNRGTGIRDLDPGLYGLSNHLLDTPWPKVRRGKAALQRALDREGAPDVEELLGILADGTPAADDLLPHTGVGLEHERSLSPICVRGEDYGTRCSTVLLLSHDGEVTLAERSFDAAGVAMGTVTHGFKIEQV
ncbi:MAG: NRDE family protein [Chromatiales bacterium]